MIIFLIVCGILAAFVIGFFLGVRFDSNAAIRHEEWKRYHGIGPLYSHKEEQHE